MPTSIPRTLGYVHSNGALISTAQDTAQFNTDKTICLGEMTKAQMSAAPLHASASYFAD